jgi:hypothetical protein
MVEFRTHSQSCERGWKVVNGPIEMITKGQSGERKRDTIYWLVERGRELKLVRKEGGNLRRS